MTAFKPYIMPAVVLMVAFGLLALFDWLVPTNQWIHKINGTNLWKGIVTVALGVAVTPAVKQKYDRLIETLGSSFRMRLLLNDLEKSTSNLDIKTTVHEKKFTSFFKTVDRKRLQNLSPDESACFILGAQYFYRNIVIHSDVELQDFLSVAARAAESDTYRRLLLTHSLGVALFTKQRSENLEMAKSLLDKNVGGTRVEHHSEDEDEKLFAKLERAQGERIYISSTTSQVSIRALNQFREHHHKIKEINLLMVSPLIESDSALLELGHEYDVPTCALPVAQFIKNRNIDYLRRVMRILAGIDTLLEFKSSTGIDVKLWLLRKRYIGIKVRILEERAYMQLLPGSLRYANNMYRFGLEISDKDMIDVFIEAIQKLCANPDEVTPVALTKFHVQQIRDNALRQAAKFLFRSKESIAEIDNSAARLRFIVKSPLTDFYIERIKRMLKSMNSVIDNFTIEPMQLSPMGQLEKNWSEPRKLKTPSPVVKVKGKSKTHISVGILLIRDGRLLMVRKCTSPNSGKLSIVAGHVNEGESAMEALRREVSEEIGIEIDESHCSLTKHYDVISDACRHGASRHEWYVFVSEQSIRDADITLDNRELTEFIWIKLDEVDKIAEITPAAKKILGDLDLL